MADPTDEQLRESARHRGLKLLKSRRRKPGGDFGRYGLADAADKPVLGVGNDGLTATATEVADFLRKGDAATWASSVEATPARAAPAPLPKPAEQDTAAPRKKRSRAAPPTRKPTPEPRPDKPRPNKPPPEPPAPPEPDLVIRPAARADAQALATLLPDVPTAVLAERIAAAAASGEPVLVAEQGEVIGCLAWHVLPTLRHGPVARITFLAVIPTERRRGIATRLLDRLVEQAAARDLPLVEAISDIAIQSAHGFFRRRAFDQASYRFTRPIEP